MLDGITVLSTTTHVILDTIWVWNPLSFIMFCGIILSIIVIIMDVSTEMFDGIGFIIGLVLVFFLAVFIYPAGLIDIEVGKYNTYKVTLEDTVSMTDFYERYELINKDGEIWEIKEILQE